MHTAALRLYQKPKSASDTPSRRHVKVLPPLLHRPSLPPPHTPFGDALRLRSDGFTFSVLKNTPADLETCTNSKQSSRPPFLPLQQLPRRLGVAAYGEAHVGNGLCDLESARRRS